MHAVREDVLQSQVVRSTHINVKWEQLWSELPTCDITKKLLEVTMWEQGPSVLDLLSVTTTTSGGLLLCEKTLCCLHAVSKASVSSAGGSQSKGSPPSCWRSQWSPHSLLDVQDGSVGSALFYIVIMRTNVWAWRFALLFLITWSRDVWSVFMFSSLFCSVGMNSNWL